MFIFQGLFLGDCDAHQVVKVFFLSRCQRAHSDRTSSWKKEHKSHSLRGNSPCTGSWPTDKRLSFHQGV